MVVGPRSTAVRVTSFVCGQSPVMPGCSIEARLWTDVDCASHLAAASTPAVAVLAFGSRPVQHVYGGGGLTVADVLDGQALIHLR
jgi:hypothetical protein